VRNGEIIDERRHLARLDRSLNELSMAAPMDHRAMGVVLRETVRRNRVKNGIVYFQVTRGVARRDFAFPSADTAPALVCLARSMQPAKGEKKAKAGVAVITIPDIRWTRVDIKTTGLLAQSLARQQAKEAGADEAWMVDREGFVTEGASCNAWIVTKDGVLVTRPAESGILKGITRGVAMDVAAAHGFRFEERRFTVDEAKAAREAFQTSASALVMPVVKIDGTVIGDGKPGPVARALREHYHEQAEASTLDRLLHD
jgi:D-alanine transaminase